MLLMLPSFLRRLEAGAAFVVLTARLTASSPHGRDRGCRFLVRTASVQRSTDVLGRFSEGRQRYPAD